MGISILLICLTPIALILMGLSSLLLLEVIIASWVKDQPVDDSLTDPGPLAVLIPAHNEAIVIQATLEQLKPQLKPTDTIVVVADNCSDATADLARSMGVTVLERQDDTQRGKGYALDFGLKALAADPPDVVVVVDADCCVAPGALARLHHQVLASGKPAQAIYLMEQPPNPSPNAQISAFAFKVKNWVRPLGLTQLSFPCPLTGTGMAFPWQVIADVDLASGNIVEDMKLGVDLAIMGYPTLLCPAANVTGQLPTSETATTTQRTRWEHGHLQTLMTYVPQLFRVALTQRRLDLAIMAADLAIPPLALLVMIALGTTLGTIVSGVLGAGWLPSFLMLITGLVIFAAILLAWARFGRDDLPIQRLLSVPLYILWKIPLYLKFIVNPQNLWVRTDRGSTTD